MFYNTGISTYIWIVSNRKPKHRKGKVQLIDASGMWEKMRKSLGSKRKQLNDDHIDEITRLFGKAQDAWLVDGEIVSGKALASGPDRGPADNSTEPPVPISRIFKTTDFGYQTITVERPLRDEAGNIVEETRGKKKGLPKPDSKLRDSEEIPLDEDIEEYFEREVLPHVPGAWFDHEKTKIGYEIPFNRHFYVFKPPRELDEIDAELKGVTDRIVQMIGELSS